MALGVAGQVSDKGLYRILNGAHPNTAARLGRPPRGRRRVTGFDLTFRAPKSVSVLWGLGSFDVASQIRVAHERAVAQALGYLERHACLVAHGHARERLEHAGGFVGAAFLHRASRAGDPLLHTHVVIANLARGPDGRWTALDGRALYAHAKTAGYLYQAVLRQELTVRLGVAWQPVSNGTADLAGIPRPLLELLSKRRRQILARLAERGERSAKAAQAAALDTRRSKANQAPASQQALRDRWWAEATRHGFDLSDLRQVLGRVRQRPMPIAATRLLGELAGPAGLTAHSSTFTRRDVIQAICDRLPAGGDVAVIEALADQFLAAEELVCALAWRPGHDGRGDVIRRGDERIVPALAGHRRFSTHELLAVEATVIAGALRRRGQGCAVVPEATVAAALAASPALSAEQAAMVWALTTSGDGVQTVHAKAGAGKTFALAAVRQAWEAAGFRVLGAALSAQAARVLADGAGIPATTLARLLFHLDQPGWSRLAGGTVVVIDEAGMVGTRMLARLLAHAERAGAKVVLAGDSEQLPEIEAGGCFRGLVARLGAVELRHNHRQREPWEQQALDLLRAGDAVAALAAYCAHGRVVVRRRAGQLRAELVADWWAATRQSHRDLTGQAAVMIAARHVDVDDLNLRARALLAAAGDLGSKTLIVAGREFAVGDHGVCQRL